MSAELNVQLRLLTDKLQEDAAKAAAIVKKNLSKPPVIKPGSNDEEGGGQSMAQGMYRMVMSYIRFKVFSYAVDKLRNAIEQFTKAIKDAHARYAEAATSGFGIGTFTKRQGIAKILGVDANDVYRFGGAFAFLNNRMKDSFDTIARGTRPLAELNMSWEMMKVDMEALFVKLAIDMKPAMESFIEGLDKIIKFFSRFPQIITGMFKSWSMMTGLGWLFKIPEIIGGKDAGMSKGIPALNPQMKQLPASSWERMGLVIGGGATRNYQQETAKNTEKTVRKLDMLIKVIGKQDYSIGVSAMPSTP